MSSDRSKCTYDVCLSFASEDRDYVESVASQARNRNIHVFYDKPLMHMAPVARVCHQMLRLRLGRGNG